jgi:hypothetical protein
VARSVLEAVSAFFQQDGWRAEPLDDGALRVRFEGDSGSWTCLAIAREEQRQFIFYSVFDVFVTPDRRPSVEELITRANWSMAVGNFEMDVGTGEVRYKTSVDVGIDDLTANLAQRAVYANVITMNRYLPALHAVVSGDLLPAAAVQMVEDALG